MMHFDEVRLIGFEDDEALDDTFTGFLHFDDYKAFLPNHLTEILRKQHPSMVLRSVQLLRKPNLDFGGMPSPENKDHIIVDTMTIPLELRLHLSNTGSDSRELDITLIFNATHVNTTPQITSDMFIRNERALS